MNYANQAMKLLTEAKFSKKVEESEILIDSAFTNAYATGHLYRFERTFKHIQGKIDRSAALVVDLGASILYQPELRKTFPQATFRFSGPYKKPEWFELDLEADKLPLEDNSVDVVLLLEVIEHFYEDPMHCMSEINRVLKPGGKVFMTTPNILSVRSTIGALLGYAPYFHMKYERKKGARRHVHEYAPYQLTDTLIASGMKAEVWTENVYMRDTPELLEWMAGFGFPTKDRGDTIFGIGTKIGPVMERYPKMTYT